MSMPDPGVDASQSYDSKERASANRSVVFFRIIADDDREPLGAQESSLGRRSSR